jgi:hypothetical protein
MSSNKYTRIRDNGKIDLDKLAVKDCDFKYDDGFIDFLNKLRIRVTNDELIILVAIMEQIKYNELINGRLSFEIVTIIDTYIDIRYEAMTKIIEMFGDQTNILRINIKCVNHSGSKYLCGKSDVFNANNIVHDFRELKDTPIPLRVSLKEFNCCGEKHNNDDTLAYILDNAIHSKVDRLILQIWILNNNEEKYISFNAFNAAINDFIDVIKDYPAGSIEYSNRFVITDKLDIKTTHILLYYLSMKVIIIFYNGERNY